MFVCVCLFVCVCVFVYDQEKRRERVICQVRSKPLSSKEVSLRRKVTETFVPLKVARERVVPFRTASMCRCLCVYV